MLVACWGVKGGVGTTVTAAGLGLTFARAGHETVLVDLTGDLGAVLGLPEGDRPGVGEWLAAGPTVPADALGRLEAAVTPALTLLRRGSGPLGSGGIARLLEVLDGDDRRIVVDCGLVRSADEARGMAAARATHSLLVTRACFLALRLAASPPLRPSAVVLVSEVGRALDRGDVEEVVGAPVCAEVAVDPAVARAVDAGLLTGRLPRGFQRALAAAT